MTGFRVMLLIALLAAFGSAQNAPASKSPQAPRQRAESVGFQLTAADQVGIVRTRADGSAQRIAGRLTTQGASRAARADDFVARHGAAFGLQLQDQAGAARALGVTDEHLFVPQLVHGFELEGHGLTLRFGSDESVRLAHGVFSPDTLDVAPPAADPTSSAQRGFASAGFDVARARLSTTVERHARLGANGLQLLYVVEVLDGALPYILDIDAWTGELLGVRENWVDGKVKTGNFRYDGVDVVFPTRSAKGRVFKSVAAAFKGKSAPAALPSIAAEEIEFELAPLGSLTGRFVQIIEGFIAPLVSLGFDFAYNPIDPAPAGTFNIPGAQVFDHANTYYWLNRMGRSMAKLYGDAFPADYSVPTIVNFDNDGEGYFNAFFTTGDLDFDGPLEPGFLLFGELTAVTNNWMHDFSRDPTVICHEYTHMTVSKLGGSFGSVDRDQPSRGFNEGIADYAAGAFLKDPVIGKVFVEHTFGGDLNGSESFRNMLDELSIDEHLFDVLGIETGLPAEHAVGGVFGSAMWRARQRLGRKVADELFLTALLDLPQNSAETGHPVVTPDNADEAYAAYAFGIFQSWFDTLLAEGGKKSARRAQALTGAMMVHGLTGTGDHNAPVFDLVNGAPSLSIHSTFLGAIDDHVIDVQVAEGQTLSISLVGKLGAFVEFDFDAEPGIEIAPALPKTKNAKGTKQAWKKIGVLQSGVYRISLHSNTATDASYRLKVRAS